MTNKKKPTNLEVDVRKCIPELIHGSVLAIDPSSGSASSLPGFALFQDSKLVDSGILGVDRTKNVHKKLISIAECLRTEFDRVDVLVSEDIIIMMGGNKFTISSSSLRLLQWSLGTIISSVRAEHLVLVHPTTWHKQVPVNYEKTDENDAISLGYTAIRKAYELSDALSEFTIDISKLLR